MNYKLKINSHTWNKDSNLLFDYESNDFTSRELNLSSSGVLTKRDKILYFNKTEKKNTDYVGSITCREDEYNLTVEPELESPNGKEKSIDDKLWIVIKNTKFKGNLGYRLREGDIIKFGKVMFKVRELKSEKKELKNKTQIFQKTQLFQIGAFGKEKTLGEINNFNNEINFIQPEVKKNKRISAICRICLMDDNDYDNPLINPCQCIGSVKFIHVACIRQWLKCKITTKVFNFLTVHSFKSFECELCKTTISEKIKFRNEILSLIDYDKPETNFIMLESITRETRETKYLYIILMRDKNSIQLGRSNDSDVRMTDISVSRNHALLKLIEGEFYLEDNSSKFGTLVQLQNDVTIIPSKEISIQSGKIYLIFSLTKTCLAWLRCYSNSKLNNMDYNEYFDTKPNGGYQEELAKIKVLNSDYSISSDYNSNMKISQQGKESNKDFKDFDNLIYQKTKKLIKRNENEEMGDPINFKTNNNEATSNKLVLTENCIFEERLNKDRVPPTNSSLLNGNGNHIHYKPILNASVSVFNYITNNDKDSMNLLASYTNSFYNNENLFDKSNLGLVNKNAYNSNQSKPVYIESTPNIIVNAPLSSKNKKGEEFFKGKLLKKNSVDDINELKDSVSVSPSNSKPLTNTEKHDSNLEEKSSIEDKQFDISSHNESLNKEQNPSTSKYNSFQSNKIHSNNKMNNVSCYDSSDNEVVKAMIDNVFGNINYISNTVEIIDKCDSVMDFHQINNNEIYNNFCFTKSYEKSLKMSEVKQQVTRNEDKSLNLDLHKQVYINQTQIYSRNPIITQENFELKSKTARRNSNSSNISVKSESDITYSRRSIVSLLNK